MWWGCDIGAIEEKQGEQSGEGNQDAPEDVEIFNFHGVSGKGEQPSRIPDTKLSGRWKKQYK